MVDPLGADQEEVSLHWQSSSRDEITGTMLGNFIQNETKELP